MNENRLKVHKNNHLGVPTSLPTRHYPCSQNEDNRDPVGKTRVLRRPL